MASALLQLHLHPPALLLCGQGQLALRCQGISVIMHWSNNTMMPRSNSMLPQLTQGRSQVPSCPLTHHPGMQQLSSKPRPSPSTMVKCWKRLQLATRCRPTRRRLLTFVGHLTVTSQTAAETATLQSGFNAYSVRDSCKEPSHRSLALVAREQDVVVHTTFILKDQNRARGLR